jgi:cytidylate kinase
MARHVSAISQLIDQNVQKWVSAAHASQGSRNDKTAESLGPYIVISRETGAGGSAIAKRVGQKLGWNVLDEEILDHLAREYGTPRKHIRIVDERYVHWIEEMFETWIDGQGFSQATYMHRLGHLFFLAAKRGNVVIVGRGARFILPPECGLSVRIVAPFDFRVEQVLLRRGLSVKKAREFVKRSDRQREAFIAKNFHHQVTDPHLHDLVINVEKLVQEDAADLIIAAAHSFVKKSGLGRIRVQERTPER